MPHSTYVYEIEDIIAEINSRTGTRIQLHPSWHYPLWSAAGGSLSFKLRAGRDNSRPTMDLSVNEKDFVAVSQTRKQLTAAARERIIHEIEAFFVQRGSATR